MELVKSIVKQGCGIYKTLFSFRTQHNTCLLYTSFCDGRCYLFDSYAAFDFDSEENYKCVSQIIFVLYSICLPCSHDLSGYFVCNRICDFCNGRISCSNSSGTQEKKPGDSGTVFLYRGICDREAVGNDLISYIKWCKLIKIQKSRQTMEVYFVNIYRKFQTVQATSQ